MGVECLVLGRVVVIGLFGIQVEGSELRALGLGLIGWFRVDGLRFGVWGCV